MHKPDSYADKGAGFFLFSYGGVEVEMMGRRSNLSGGAECAPEFRGIPTRVQVSGVWARTHASPGLYARSRYVMCLTVNNHCILKVLSA